MTEGCSLTISLFSIYSTNYLSIPRTSKPLFNHTVPETLVLAHTTYIWLTVLLIIRQDITHLLPGIIVDFFRNPSINISRRALVQTYGSNFVDYKIILTRCFYEANTEMNGINQ